MTEKALLPRIWVRALVILVAVAIAALLASCTHFYPPKAKAEPEPEPVVVEKKPPPEPIKPPPPSRLYDWFGSDDYVSRIEISINEQKARFYSGEKEVGWTTVASGVHRYPTPVGSFAVLEKVQNKKSNLYGRIYNKNGKLVKRNAKLGVDSVPQGGRFKGASMPYFMRLTNDGIGMHAGPIPRPGNRASHGCIRMPKKFAPILYRYVDVGTPVTIKGNGPTYASYLSKQRRSAPRPVPTAAAQPDTAVATVQTPASPASGDSPAVQQPVKAPSMDGVPSGATDAVVQASGAAAAQAQAPTAAGLPGNPPASAASATADVAETGKVSSASPADASPVPTSSEGVVPATVTATAPVASESAPSEVPSSGAGGSEPSASEAAASPPPDQMQKPVALPVEGSTGTPLGPESGEGLHPAPVEAPPAAPPTEAAEAVQRTEG